VALYSLCSLISGQAPPSGQRLYYGRQPTFAGSNDDRIMIFYCRTVDENRNLKDSFLQKLNSPIKKYREFRQDDGLAVVLSSPLALFPSQTVTTVTSAIKSHGGQK